MPWKQGFDTLHDSKFFSIGHGFPRINLRKEFTPMVSSITCTFGSIVESPYSMATRLSRITIMPLVKLFESMESLPPKITLFALDGGSVVQQVVQLSRSPK